MKRSKVLCPLLACLVLLAALLGGCGSKSAQTEETTPKTPEEVIKLASQNLDAVKGYHFISDMVINMTAEVMGKTQELGMNVSMTGDIVNKPMQSLMDATMDLGEQMGGEQNFKMYMTQEGDKASLYMSLDDGATWTTAPLDSASLAQYDTGKNLEMFMGMLKDAKEAGSDTINDAKATRYDCVISMDNLNEVLKASGVLNSVSSMGITEEELTKMYADLGDLPFTLWVDDENMLPVQYQFDMTEMMDKMMKNALDSYAGDDAQAQDFSIKVSKVEMKMTISKYDEITSISAPENLPAVSETENAEMTAPDAQAE